MEDMKGINSPGIDSEVETIMELICGNCFSSRETPTGCECPDCKTCIIEDRIRALVLEVQSEHRKPVCSNDCAIID